MLRVLFIFILLAGSTVLGLQLHRDPGYVLIALNQTTLETTLWFGLFAVLLTYFLLYIVIRIANALLLSPYHFRRWRKKRKKSAAAKLTRKGLVEFSEGYWQAAEKHLISALPLSETPLINYLIAARSAQEIGKYTQRDNYLRQAQQSMPETEIAIELTQAQLQLANKQWEQALATLRHLQDLAPKHPYVLKLLAKLYEAVKDWPHLIKLLPDLKRYQVLSKAHYISLSRHVYISQIRHLIAHNRQDEVRLFIEQTPKIHRQNPLVLAEIARFYKQQGHDEKAKRILKNSLSKRLNEHLLGLLSDLTVNETDLKFVESLTVKNPHSADLLLCCGKICLQLTLWGKAKKYLQQSIDLCPMKEAYWQLACLLERLHQEEEALALFKKGYSLKINAKDTP